MNTPSSTSPHGLAADALDPLHLDLARLGVQQVLPLGDGGRPDRVEERVLPALVLLGAFDHDAVGHLEHVVDALAADAGQVLRQVRGEGRR